MTPKNANGSAITESPNKGKAKTATPASNNPSAANLFNGSNTREYRLQPRAGQKTKYATRKGKTTTRPNKGLSKNTRNAKELAAANARATHPYAPTGAARLDAAFDNPYMAFMSSTLRRIAGEFHDCWRYQDIPLPIQQVSRNWKLRRGKPRRQTKSSPPSTAPATSEAAPGVSTGRPKPGSVSTSKA